MGSAGCAIAPLTAGVTLPIFTAAYLIGDYVDRTSILRAGPSDWLPISRVGEAAFLALGMSFGGATIGLELAGIARVIAFVQLLLTLSAVVAVLLWGYHRITRAAPLPSGLDRT